MRRLHLQIFRALVATGVLCLGVTMLAAWLLRGESQRMPRFVQDMGAFIVADLPEDDQAAFEHGLRQRAKRLHASLSVWDQDGRLIAQVGRRLGPKQLTGRERVAFDHLGKNVRIGLPDGRWLGISFEDPSADFTRGRVAMGLLMVLGTLLLGSYLAARRITRRLERLERAVSRLGAGDLAARVEVRGRDEIARLARAFNHSFDRIAGLLQQQRRMLQSASHELRSPLARLRMAMELLTEPTCTDEARKRLRLEAARDVEELDALIGDLLLAERLSDTELEKRFADVPLMPIVVSEAGRVSASFSGVDVTISGDARMLRGLIRNLLENARRYGKDPLTARLTIEGREVVLCVEDAGEGVAEAERARIFEPFYRPAGHREGKDGGVGLGLSLVKNIAEHHGGSVRYVPSKSGSCFEVRLPLSTITSRSASPAPP
jgi:two-component system, OmpR family, sensor kinase